MSLYLLWAHRLFFQASTVFDAYFTSQVSAKLPAFASVFSLVLSAIVKICLIKLEAPLIWFAVSIGVDSATEFVALLYMLKYHTTHLHISKIFSWEIASRLIKESWPYLLSGLLITVYMRIDQIMIKEMMSDYFVGQYAVAVRLSEAWYLLPMIITSSVYPAIVNAKKVSNDLYLTRLRSLYSPY